MITRLVSLILLIPASWLLFSTLILMVVFMVLNIQGWIGCIVYLPLTLLVIDLLVLPRVLLLDRVKVYLSNARKHTRNKDFEAANQCYEQALFLQHEGKRLGLSLVLKEYAHYLSNVDEMDSRLRRQQAKAIQIDALKGLFQDDFRRHIDNY